MLSTKFSASSNSCSILFSQHPSSSDKSDSNGDFHPEVELDEAPGSTVINIEETNRKNKYAGIKPYKGMLLSITSAVCSSFVTLFVKLLSGYGVDQYGSTFWRYVGITVPTIPILLFYGWGVKRVEGESIFSSVWPPFFNGNWKTWIALFTRGLIGSTAVILENYSMQYLDIGDTSVIVYSTPVLVTIMAHFCLGEKISFVPAVVAFTTLSGVTIMMKPPLLTGSEEFDRRRVIGALLACGALFCLSLVIIITRKIRQVHFAVMVMVFGSIGLTQSGLMALTLGHLNWPTALADTLLILGVAGLSFLVQIASVLALKFEQAGPVALIWNCEVVFVFLLQFAFLGVVPDVWSSVGGGIVLTGVIVIALRKYLGSLPDSTWIKQKKWWLLKWVLL